MNRRAFLQASSTAMAAGFFLPEWAPQPAKAAARVVAGPPVLQNPSERGMTVFAPVDTLSTAWVEYGETPDLGRRADGAVHGLLPLDARVHRLRLDGLSPGTRYHYRVVACPIDFKGPYKITRGAPVASEVRTFTTLDGGRLESTTFAVINDTHETPETLTGLVERMKASSPDLLFWNGDIFNDVRSEEQVAGQIMRPAGDAAYAAERPLCFVSGNHDVRGVHARLLDRYIDVPGGRRYYTLRRGPVAFIVLDTGEDKPDNHAVYAGLGAFARYRELQQAWLREAVASEEFRSAPVKVAILHIPLWGPGCSDDSRERWHTLLESAGVCAVINGHTHTHSVTPANAEHAYMQVVGGGPKPETATIIDGRARGRELSLVVRNLAGREIGSYIVKG